MSIQQQNQIKELQGRMDKLEKAFNKINTEPRKVAGVSDPDPKPEPKKAKKKVEGNQ